MRFRAQRHQKGQRVIFSLVLSRAALLQLAAPRNVGEIMSIGDVYAQLDGEQPLDGQLQGRWDVETPFTVIGKHVTPASTCTLKLHKGDISLHAELIAYLKRAVATDPKLEVTIILTRAGDKA